MTLRTRTLHLLGPLSSLVLTACPIALDVGDLPHGKPANGTTSDATTAAATSSSDPPATTTTTPTTGDATTSTGEATATVASTTGGLITDGPTGSTTGVSPGSSTTTASSDNTTTAVSSSGDTGGEPVGSLAECPQNFIEQGCPAVDCNKSSCGGLFDDVDELGLVRKSCDPNTCACDPGFTCFQPVLWGGCQTTNRFCNGGTENCGGVYCVPDAIGLPPFACGGTDEASCEAAGCTFVMAPWIIDDGTCHCNAPAPTCLWFPKQGDSVAAVTAYYNANNLADVRLFPAAWSEPPWPWKQCAGDPGAPVSCGCADECIP